MATLRKNPSSDKYDVLFWYKGKRYCRSCGTTRERDAQSAKVRVEDRIRILKAGHIEMPEDVEDVATWIVTEGRLSNKPSRKGGQSEASPPKVADLVADYLEHRQLRVRSGQLSLGSYASDKYRLKTFTDHCEKKRATRLDDVLAAEFLAAYKARLLKDMAKEKYSAVSVKHALRTVKAMLLWAYDEEKIDSLPRQMRKYADIALPEPKPKFFTPKQVKSIHKAASDPVKLYILLGVNCGYSQIDIATLAHDMIDWETGFIDRTRHKTRHKARVGSKHKLWPATLRLLEDQASEPGQSEYVLLTRHGMPLVREELWEDGTPSKTDMVAHSFSRLREEIGGGILPFKHFRKTGANAIAKQYQKERWLVDLYLAHAAGGMRRHYTEEHFDRLHEATDWLGTVYGFK